MEVALRVAFEERKFFRVSDLIENSAMMGYTSAHSTTETAGTVGLFDPLASVRLSTSGEVSLLSVSYKNYSQIRRVAWTSSWNILTTSSTLLTPTPATLRATAF